VEALQNDALIHEAPAIIGRLSPSALAHGGAPKTHTKLVETPQEEHA